MDKNMKMLAKKRAKSDPDVTGSVDWAADLSSDQAKARESSRNMDDLKRAMPDESENEDLKDHRTKSVRVKQQRKFGMLRKMLGEFNDMDGDGVPD